MNYNQRVNAAVIEIVAKSPGINLHALQMHVRNAVDSNRRSGDYFMGGGYFYQRVERMVRRGKLRKLVFKADGPNEAICGHYYTPDKIPLGFDLAKETDRLVAADYVQDRDDEKTAAALRRATRGN